MYSAYSAPDGKTKNVWKVKIYVLAAKKRDVYDEPGGGGDIYYDINVIASHIITLKDINGY